MLERYEKAIRTRRNNNAKWHSEETKGKMSKAKIGKKFTKKHKENLSKSLKGGNITSFKNGHQHNKETLEKMSNSLRGRKAWNKGRKLTKEHISKLKESHKGQKCWCKGLKLGKEPEHLKEKRIRAVLKGLMKRPTSFERKISELCFKYNLPFVYKGNGGFLINFKNPDFVNEKDRIVIEVFYSYFKIRDYGSVENYKRFCKQKYESAGWKVIFIDEIDLKGDDWEKVCLEKIKLKWLEQSCVEIMSDFPSGEQLSMKQEAITSKC
jgi:hypothetical protein